MTGVPPALQPYLDAWREDSRTLSPLNRREQAREAMLTAVATLASNRSGARALSPASFLKFRLRHGRPILAGAGAVLAGVLAVAVLGWNAPAGSPLYGVRVARQGVQLVIPGGDPAALHLQFAEASLSDARNGVDIAASLADARAELSAAATLLRPDRASTLWSRWRMDESTLTTEQQDWERETESAPPGSAPSAAPGETPDQGEGSSPSAGVGSAQPTAPSSGEPSERPDGGSPAPTSSGGGEHETPQPSGSGDGGGGDR